jgi:hypothetical protein
LREPNFDRVVWNAEIVERASIVATAPRLEEKTGIVVVVVVVVVVVFQQ